MKRWFGWFSAALTLFLLLPQRAPHSMDTHFFVVWLEEGHRDYPRHPLYMQLARDVFDLLQPFGVRPYTALLVLSALGAAVGIASAAAAARRLLDGAWSPWLLPLGLCCVPSVFYYATAAEIGGVAFGAAGLSWLAFVHMRSAPGPARGAWLGVCTGLAAGVHAFGHLLPLVFAMAAWQLGLGGVRALWRTVLAGALAHVAVAVAAALVAGVGARGQASDAIGHLQERWATYDLTATPTVFWREWVVSYLPWSLLAFVGLADARSRAWCRIALLGLALHLPLTVLLLGSIHADEDGMYHLALAVPVVVAGLQQVERRRLHAVLLAGAIGGLWLAGPHWTTPGSAGFGEGLRQLRAEGRFLLVATTPERDAARARVDQDLVILELDRLLGFYAPAQQSGQSVADWWRGMMAQQGDPVLLTAASADVIRRFGPPFEPLWPAIEQGWRVEPVQRADFQGYWLRPR